MTRGGGARGATGRGHLLARIWLVLSPSDSEYEKRLRQAVSQEAAELGLDVVLRRSRQRRLSVEGRGSRPVNVLEPVDAHELYRDLSVRQCYVLSRGSIFVLRDPRRDPPTKRDCLPLEQFVQHKAAFRTIEDGQSVKAVLRELTDIDPSDCKDQHDPRVLPLHVFDPGADGRQLGTDEGRRSFRASYLRGRAWESAATGSWAAAVAGAWHGIAGAGGDVLRVWKYLVPQGFHWDTNAGQKRRNVITAVSVWRVEKRGYVNVYPDSHVRVGANAKEIWHARR